MYYVVYPDESLDQHARGPLTEDDAATVLSLLLQAGVKATLVLEENLDAYLTGAA